MQGHFNSKSLLFETFYSKCILDIITESIGYQFYAKPYDGNIKNSPNGCTVRYISREGVIICHTIRKQIPTKIN